MRFLKYFINLLLIIVIVMFFIENSTELSQKIAFRFDTFVPGLEWTFPELPLYLLMLLIFALGAVLAMFSFAIGRWRIGLDLRRANNKIRKLEKEIKAYRQLSLATEEINTEEAKAPSQPE